MIKYIAFLFLTVTLICKSFSQITDPSPYCTSTFGSTSSYPALLKVAMDSFISTTSHTPKPSYMYYNNLSSADIQRNDSSILRLTYNNVDQETMIRGWIDFNNNHQFEPNEQIIDIPQGSVGMGMNLSKQVAFFVPSGSYVGKVRMRISIGWHFADWPNSIFRLDSCHNALTNEYSAGETEDYDVIIGSTGIRKLTDHTFFRIYPIPFNDYLLIDYKGDIEAKFELIDLTGKTEFNYIRILKGTNRIDIPKLTSGIYIIKIIAAEKVFYQMVAVLSKE